ncbi:LysM peptidoglycan-binding domain-containing protein [Bacteriovoracales bacterium]|nr:LysM peptidoglycan-binding domain-containing protein [Bacteriovoracales bacterium]
MGKFKVLFLLLLFLLQFSCSKTKKKEDPEKATPDIVKDESNERKTAEEELIVEEETTEEGEEEELIVEEDVEKTGETQAEKTSEDKKEISLSGNIAQYKVKKGETLMLIAFKVYGDYGKWKSIAEQNPQLKVKGIRAGMSLKYDMPTQEFSWQPVGLAHLIKSGETLGKISKNKYGTSKKWKNIWNNNKPLIKNPNLIFAGFTIYYKPGGKELASW